MRKMDLRQILRKNGLEAKILRKNGLEEKILRKNGLEANIDKEWT